MQNIIDSRYLIESPALAEAFKVYAKSVMDLYRSSIENSNRQISLNAEREGRRAAKKLERYLQRRIYVGKAYAAIPPEIQSFIKMIHAPSLIRAIKRWFSG